LLCFICWMHAEGSDPPCTAFPLEICRRSSGRLSPVTHTDSPRQQEEQPPDPEHHGGLVAAAAAMAPPEDVPADERGEAGAAPNGHAAAKP
jgi:hypothetical protein